MDGGAPCDAAEEDPRHDAVAGVRDGALEGAERCEEDVRQEVRAEGKGREEDGR